MPDPIIRRATPADAAATAAYMRALRAEVAEGGLDTVPWRRPLTDEEQRAALLKIEANPHSAMFIALDGKTVIGIGELAGGENVFDRHQASLAISLAKGWRGKGIGRKLMAALVDEAKTWTDFCRIELECVTWNTNGIALYESLGFVVEARKRKAVNLRGLPEDKFMMALVW